MGCVLDCRDRVWRDLVLVRSKRLLIPAIEMGIEQDMCHLFSKTFGDAQIDVKRVLKERWMASIDCMLRSYRIDLRVEEKRDAAS